MREFVSAGPESAVAPGMLVPPEIGSLKADFHVRRCAWLTQKWSRYVCDHGYGTGPEGLGGNEDCGQMSAWYVFAAAGFYPVSPVDKIYILGSPVFDRTSFRTSRGTTFCVRRSGDGIYLSRATLNGESLERAWITHDEVVAGGELQLTMSPEPSEWGAKLRP